VQSREVPERVAEQGGDSAKAGAGGRAGQSSCGSVILANLDQIAEDLGAGAVVVIGDDWIRIRRLPMPG
jgi:hypothetical protein